MYNFFGYFMAVYLIVFGRLLNKNKNSNEGVNLDGT